MAHFLYRPHVSGPRNDITTPDIMIDRVFLLADGERGYVPVHRLSSLAELQMLPEKLEIAPAYAIIAAGGGSLLSVAALVRYAGEPAGRGEILVARSAWRLRNLVDRFDDLQLRIAMGTQTEIVALSRLARPADILSRAEEGELALPRGVVALCAAKGATMIASAPAEISVGIVDQKMGRALTHRAALVSVNADRWDERPLPRYTVGPTGEVQHYI